jgi:predicted DNA-binding transcriptional regulator AlpA
MKRRIRKSEVLEKMGWSASTLNQRVADGEFIKPIYEGIIPYWMEEEVDTFIDKFFNLPSDDQDIHPTAAA